MYYDKVLYIPKEYIKNPDLKEFIYIKEKDDDEKLGKIWRCLDFNKAEDKIYELQCELTRAVFRNNNSKIRRIQDKIVHSVEAKMLAVRKVSEISKSKAGIDGIVWRKDSDKMRATILLNNGTYKSKPLKQFVFRDKKSGKERCVGIPTVFDRAMQVLYSFALEPIAEALGDRKSFAFRKRRSHEQAHSFIMNCLMETNAPEWILVTDIESYYDTISHEWILNNIPLNKYILKNFINAGFVLNGCLFEKNEGISLGCNLSTLLGNMVLDGLQKMLYKLQGNKIEDYSNGWCLRFADDILVTARTKEDAEFFLKEIKKFISVRGLKLSEKKTKIVNVKDGFDFLSRTYIKIDGVIRCIPADKAVCKFEEEIEKLIFFNKDNWSQSKLIQSLNVKITGFATYHKCEESAEVFKRLDVIINALILKMLKEVYPNISKEKLIKRYWVIDSEGRNIFTLVSNKNKHLKNLSDTILINEERINLSKNIFLNREYFQELAQKKDIQNCVGKYKKIWDRQEGFCYICARKIKESYNKDIIYKKSSKDKSIKNIAYVHSICKDSLCEYIDVDQDDFNTLGLKEIISDIEGKNRKNKKESSKFINLTAYFHNIRKNKVTLTFTNIEKILKFKLCNSAYKYKSYFFNKQKGMIAECWISQGYKIKNIDMEQQKIDFERVDFRRNKVIIPRFMYRLDLPSELVDESKKFFLHLKEKYRL